jgi:hypothetical protein
LGECCFPKEGKCIAWIWHCTFCSCLLLDSWMMEIMYNECYLSRTCFLFIKLIVSTTYSLWALHSFTFSCCERIHFCIYFFLLCISFRYALHFKIGSYLLYMCDLLKMKYIIFNVHAQWALNNHWIRLLKFFKLSRIFIQKIL